MPLQRWTAYRLARRALGHGPRARWALSRLVRAGDSDDSLSQYTAHMELWDAWLEDPRDEFWAALSRWRRPKVGVDDGLTRVALGLSATADDVVEAARRVGHPLAAIALARILAERGDLVDAVCEAALTNASLASFCAEHRLAPAEPHRAAVFFLLTGQDEQYRLADPDHSLLATAYQVTTEDERSRIRAKAAGEPEIVRALTDTVRRGRIARLGESEAEYLVDVLAGREDWAGLWALVKDLPVFDAATAVRRFAGWRPDGPDGTLFDALAAADPAELATSWAAVARPVTVRVPAQATNGGSISPDGRWIAVESSSHVHLFSFARGAAPELVERWATNHRPELLALDDGVLLVTKRDVPVVSGLEGPRTPGIHLFREEYSLSRTATGFAALTSDRKTSLRLRLWSGHGKDLATYERRELDVLAELGLPAKLARERWHMVIEPDSGLVAFAGDRLRLARLTDGGLVPLATAPFKGRLRQHAFSQPNRLVGMDEDGVLRVWRLDGDELHVVAERKVAGASPVDLPAAGVIVMQDMTVLGKGQRQLRYLDGETLVDLPLRDRFNQRDDTYGAFRSPDGTWLGVCYWDSVVLAEAGFAELVHRPLAATTPSDLHTVRTRLHQEWLDPATRPFLDLLHTCLVHRFGTEVALGTKAGPIPVLGDDIALGGKG